MSEIEAHLESCDRCLEAYAALASGEARLEAAVKPARGSFWRVFANRRRRPVFAMAAAALCVLLVVLSTPGGKIVWGSVHPNAARVVRDSIPSRAGRNDQRAGGHG